MKKTICLVIKSLIPGGMERVMSELAGHFSSQENINLNLIIYGKERTIFYELPEDLKIHKPSWQFDNNKRLWYTIKSLLYLRGKIKELNPDIVLSMGVKWNNFVLLALSGLSSDLYISDRCQPNKKLSFIQETLRKLLYPRAKGIIAQTQIAKNIYVSRGLNENIKVIGNPIRTISCKETYSNRENIVLTVGRLIDTKHHDRLIDIYRDRKSVV